MMRKGCCARRGSGLIGGFYYSLAISLFINFACLNDERWVKNAMKKYCHDSGTVRFTEPIGSLTMSYNSFGKLAQGIVD
jgi:hypothetical protein